MNWREEEDGDLFLPRDGDRPAMAVYYMVTYRGWCWNWYDRTDAPLPPVSTRRGLAKRDIAQAAAEQWIEAHFDAPLDAEPKAGDE